MNTFMDEDIARITTKDDWNTGSPSQIDFVMSSSSLVGVDTGVDEHMNFTTDHGPVWATFQFAALASVQSFLTAEDPSSICEMEAKTHLERCCCLLRLELDSRLV